MEIKRRRAAAGEGRAEQVPELPAKLSRAEHCTPYSILPAHVLNYQGRYVALVRRDGDLVVDR